MSDLIIHEAEVTGGYVSPDESDGSEHQSDKDFIDDSIIDDDVVEISKPTSINQDSTAITTQLVPPYRPADQNSRTIIKASYEKHIHDLPERAKTTFKNVKGEEIKEDRYVPLHPDDYLNEVFYDEDKINRYRPSTIEDRKVFASLAGKTNKLLFKRRDLRKKFPISILLKKGMKYDEDRCLITDLVGHVLEAKQSISLESELLKVQPIKSSGNMSNLNNNKKRVDGEIYLPNLVGLNSKKRVEAEQIISKVPNFEKSTKQEPKPSTSKACIPIQSSSADENNPIEKSDSISSLVRKQTAFNFDRMNYRRGVPIILSSDEESEFRSGIKSPARKRKRAFLNESKDYVIPNPPTPKWARSFTESEGEKEIAQEEEEEGAALNSDLNSNPSSSSDNLESDSSIEPSQVPKKYIKKIQSRRVINDSESSEEEDEIIVKDKPQASAKIARPSNPKRKTFKDQSTQTKPPVPDSISSQLKVPKAGLLTPPIINSFASFPFGVWIKSDTDKRGHLPIPSVEQLMNQGKTINKYNCTNVGDKRICIDKFAEDDNPFRIFIHQSLGMHRWQAIDLTLGQAQDLIPVLLKCITKGAKMHLDYVRDTKLQNLNFQLRPVTLKFDQASKELENLKISGSKNNPEAEENVEACRYKLKKLHEKTDRVNYVHKRDTELVLFNEEKCDILRVGNYLIRNRFD